MTTDKELQHENLTLRERLREAEETLEAIRSGDVDAVVVSGVNGVPQVYALETADQTYRVLVEEMQEGALTVSLNDEVLYCNRRLASIFGEDPGRIVGGSLSRFICETERAEFGWVVEVCGKAEFTISTPAGLQTPAHFSFAQLKGTAGEPDTLCCIVTDLTEQRRSSEALKSTHALLLAEVKERARTEAMLRQSQKMEAIGQLTGGVAHDFNNLLMAISGGLNMLERQPDPERLKKLKEGMRQAVDRGAGLTKQLLSFSRTKALDAEVVCVTKQIDGMRELLDRSLGGSIEVRTNFAPDAWPVRIDAGEFELVVLNLCVNARDAMPNGGAITIAVQNLPEYKADKLSGDFIAVTVRDTGTGMSAETIAHAFEPFFTTKDIGKGSGLGLAQAYGFARSSGGTLKIHSELGCGTTIEMLLPRSTSAPQIAPLPALQPAPRSARERLSGRALLVEDDDEVAEVAGEMLAEIGFHVSRVASAQSALELLAGGQTFAMIVSDIMMPGGMNGIQFAEQVRKRFQNMPLLLTSGHAAAFSDQAAALKVRLLAKPFSIDELEDSARREMDGSR
jgi:signal transduction histidine kinase/CheY-like chemotaxis protein